jgi:rubrerythrin
MHFQYWFNYFKGNQIHLDHIDWSAKDQLTEQEKGLIALSIQKFQMGEHSEGKHFLAFAKTMKDESYLQTVKIFIKEEQDHAAVLGKFMQLHGISKITKDPVDGIFRWLRKLAGIEGTITVLLTAEIIAMVYYKALKNATGSAILQKICHQILVDETMHLAFQSDTLKVIYKNKSAIGLFVSRWVHRILMAGTILVVWLFHSKVLKAGGYSLFNYFKDTWSEFRKCERMMSTGLLTTSVGGKQLSLNKTCSHEERIK